jgi:hypothetical protein
MEDGLQSPHRMRRKAFAFGHCTTSRPAMARPSVVAAKKAGNANTSA